MASDPSKLPLAQIFGWKAPSATRPIPLEERGGRRRKLPPPTPEPPREIVTLQVAIRRLGIQQGVLGNWLMAGAPVLDLIALEAWRKARANPAVSAAAARSRSGEPHRPAT